MLEAEKNNLDVPTKGEVDERKKAIEDARSFKHSMATIQQLVEHKRKLGTAPINFGTRRKEGEEKEEEEEEEEARETFTYAVLLFFPFIPVLLYFLLLLLSSSSSFSSVFSSSSSFFSVCLAVRREELKRHLKLAQQNNDEEKMLEAQNDLEKLEQAYERHLVSSCLYGFIYIWLMFWCVTTAIAQGTPRVGAQNQQAQSAI